jgi:hypothetical protein
LAKVVFAEAGQVFDKQMPARQQTGQHMLDHFRLALKRIIERGPDSLDRAGIIPVGCDRRGHHCPHFVASFQDREGTG